MNFHSKSGGGGAEITTTTTVKKTLGGESFFLKKKSSQKKSHGERQVFILLHGEKKKRFFKDAILPKEGKAKNQRERHFTIWNYAEKVFRESFLRETKGGKGVDRKNGHHLLVLEARVA